MSARDDYPGFAWRADVTPNDDPPDDIGHQCRRALDEIDSLRERVRQLILQNIDLRRECSDLQAKVPS